MKKEQFIEQTENWLVYEDIKDREFAYSNAQIRKMNIINYIKSVEAELEYKAPELLAEFYDDIENAKVRGTGKLKFRYKKCGIIYPRR